MKDFFPKDFFHFHEDVFAISLSSILCTFQILKWWNSLCSNEEQQRFQGPFPRYCGQSSLPTGSTIQSQFPHAIYIHGYWKLILYYWVFWEVFMKNYLLPCEKNDIKCEIYTLPPVQKTCLTYRSGNQQLRDGPSNASFWRQKWYFYTDSV